MVDSIPLPIPADEEVHPVKKQALDEGVLSTDLTLGPDELSMVCDLISCIISKYYEMIFRCSKVHLPRH